VWPGMKKREKKRRQETDHPFYTYLASNYGGERKIKWKKNVGEEREGGKSPGVLTTVVPGSTDEEREREGKTGKRSQGNSTVYDERKREGGRKREKEEERTYFFPRIYYRA